MAKSTAFVTPDRFLVANDTLTSGITKANPALPIASILEQQSSDGIRYRSIIRVNSLVKNIASDASLGFGEHIATFPSGLIRPVAGFVSMSSLCPTGLSATAGDVGLGTTIASGAVAVLGGTAGFEDLMEGTTLANHVAATPLASVKANLAPIQVGTTATHGNQILDGSGTAKKIHLNIASAWNQTAAENFTFSALVVLDWEFVATGLEV